MIGDVSRTPSHSPELCYSFPRILANTQRTSNDLGVIACGHQTVEMRDVVPRGGQAANCG